ncbi:MAG: EF-hand domain-containing protein [Saprospiraceae bacterium]|nr:EF-hand domain-containing protein [Saprospiraceae bacterium]
MPSKKEILNKLKILIARKFDSDKEAFDFFNKNGNTTLEKSELKKLLQDAGVGWITDEIAARQIIAKFDDDKNSSLSWKEFKKAIKALADEENW